MFLLKKILVPFLLPPGIFVTAALLAALWNIRAKRFRRVCCWLLAAAVVWAALTKPVGDKLLSGLEYAYTPPADVKADVIVVLCGGSVEGPAGAVGPSLSGASLERAAEAARLHRRYKLPIVISGGAVFASPAESPVIKKYMASLGVPADKIFTEEKSRDTFENAAFSKKLCDEKGYKKAVLVTSAYHMRRSVWAFERAGFRDLVPYPAGYLSPGTAKYGFTDYLPGRDEDLRTAMHEYLGLVFYKWSY